MQAISYLTALHNAQNTASDPSTDVLTELAVLKQLEVSLKARIDTIMGDAKTMAQLKLSQQEKTNGSFVYNGHTFSLSKELNYQIVEKPQKYTLEDGVTYRQYYYEREDHKSQASALTKRMRAIEASFPTLHPTYEPDEVILKLSVLE